MTEKEFLTGWLHLFDCISSSECALDAEAIRFINEAPIGIIKALRSQTEMLERLKRYNTN